MTRGSNNPHDDSITSDIQVLERRDLDYIDDTIVNSYVKSGSSTAWGGAQFEFLRIKAVSRSLAEKKADVERYMMEDVLSGLNGLKTPFIYLIIGSKTKVNIYLGILNRSVSKSSLPLNLDILSSSLQSTFPDIELETLSKDYIDHNIIHFFQKCQHYGIMTGIPTAKIGVEEHGIEQIERLLRGLYRQDFGYMVIADPVNDIDVIDAFDDIANVIREKSPLIKESKQYTQTSRMTMSGETLNRSMQYYVELLETLLEKLRLAKAQGMWRTMTYYFSPTPATNAKMGNLLKTVFSGEESVPEAIRTIALPGTNASALLTKFKQIELELNFHPAFSSEHPLQKIIKHKFVSVLNSRDLATLTHLPKEEMPGYDVKDTARFGVCLPDRMPADTLFIGEILDRGSGTGNNYGVHVQELVKHCLIAGVTGSGKTNTCLNLLDQLWKGNSGLPFLVIEPAKAEYRSLLNIEGYQDLQIFTLGDEMTSPFRLNPFEIIEGVKLQTHIDNLRAVFNASFIMYAPMPYVLESCIHEVYKDKGWDLTTNLNRLDGVAGKNPYGIFPTLTDLYEKVDPVVDGLGYEDRLTMDIKAGLKARIGSLRIGGKGSMLDTALSIPMDNLLNSPTVLELQSIGDDEEKAFIIGLLVARLYEYREIESKKKGSNSGLKHVTLIEEAHRLLASASTDFSNLENVSTKAKGVETFCNILSEIRAFGEGILIAEQIPTKLAQDAIKNTSLKIMHRIVARDDRDLMGDTMNLNEQQNKFIPLLTNGKAVVFSEGFNEPFLVKVSHYESSVKKVNLKENSVQDSDISRSMAKKMIPLNHVFGRHTGCKQCQHKCAYRDTANHILSKPAHIKYFNKFIFSIIENPTNLTEIFPSFRDELLIDISASLQGQEDENDMLFCILINFGEFYIKEKAKLYNIPINKMINFIYEYNELINSYFLIPVKTQLSGEIEKNLHKFQYTYKNIFTLKDGPYPGCNEFCKNKCFFKHDVARSLNDRGIDEKIMAAIKSEGDAKVRVKEICMDVARNMTISNSYDFTENIALCFFIQKSLQWSVKEVLVNVQKWFF
jgi:hypothetical protein